MTYYEVSSLKVNYGKKTVITNMDVTFNKSDITAIIGPNGSGKSTLLKAMGRLLKPVSGNILIEGQSIASLNDKLIAQKVGVLPQAPTAPLDTPVHCLVSYGRTPHNSVFSRFTKEDRETVDWAITATGLTDKRFKRLGQLSGGERQRAWIAMALAQKPEMLLLDEPTTYLDIHHQFEILELLEDLNKNHGLSVVMVLHDLNLAARFSNRIVVLKEGNVYADGTPTEILNESVIKDVFNVKSKIIEFENEGYTGRIAIPLGVIH